MPTNEESARKGGEGSFRRGAHHAVGQVVDMVEFAPSLEAAIRRVRKFEEDVREWRNGRGEMPWT